MARREQPMQMPVLQVAGSTYTGRLIFTPHALMQMEQRSIDQEEVKEVVEQPSTDNPDATFITRRRLSRFVGNRELVVVIDPNGPNIPVITAFAPSPRRTR